MKHNNKLELRGSTIYIYGQNNNTFFVDLMHMTRQINAYEQAHNMN